MTTKSEERMMEIDNRLHDIAAKALAGLPRKPGDDALDADGANRLRSRIVDDAVRIAELEATLWEVGSILKSLGTMPQTFVAHFCEPSVLTDALQRMADLQRPGSK